MFGIIRIAIVRSFFVFGVINFCLNLEEHLSRNPFEWWYYLVPVGFVLYVIFDMNVTWKQELNMNVTKSGEMTAIAERLKRIEKSLDDFIARS